MRTHIPTNNDDIIDSRDIIQWIADLTDQRDNEYADYVAWAEESGDVEIVSLEVWSGDLFEFHDDLETLERFALEGENCSDWEYGETFIRDSYFEDYAEELARDCVDGFNDRNEWPYCHIDWEAAACSLRMDYSSYSFDGVTYWAR